MDDFRLKSPAAPRSAAEFVPPDPTLPKLQEAAATCTGCELYKRATQTVFGDGPRQARIVLVGEQPGDQEDQAGHPFVGPAGRMLDEALFEVGLPRETLYITNAVKHFKWEPQGKRRKHKKPLAGEITACKPWLIAELELIQPTILVCLGATAVQAVFGNALRMTEGRGKFHATRWCPATFVTIHPSAIFRHPEREQQKEECRRFVADLRLVRTKLLQLAA